ncbi:phosphatidylinositol n-acetylglucosaminyltransferase [Colletotrichum karsti]|uniref:Phosphatidylinositol n-acetylglucosaminyltransferase n=1 Tax=Colletotrichum karsti TaxID=1095194 RepID=A0A9P6I7L7_9PEZI|nr:phosphatidylinositol n-acetylglucosaminyltransferase [Colletotrichum karsti]KAF9877714.1 phosphatidylinositol n-acetylglucosaminyltransferase [Colletotrichum karsti]
MLTTSPRLHVRRPSPTTAEFTVTTRPPPTLTIRLLSLFLLALRIVVFFSSILLVHAAWVQSPYATSTFLTPSPTPTASPYDSDDDYAEEQEPTFFSTATLSQAIRMIDDSIPGRLAQRLASSDTIPLPLLIGACVVAAYATLLRTHTTESLLVLRGLGIQTSSVSGSYLSAAATRFIPTEKIQDVLVNEAFRGFEVRYYLVVVVEGEDDLIVVFPRILPRKKIVETVWRGVRGCLWEADGGGGYVGGGGGSRRIDEKWSS